MTSPTPPTPPNPLIPQGSLLEQQAKGRSRVRLALFIVVALHVVFLGPLLIQGCKPEAKPGTPQTNAMSLPPLDTSSLVENTPPPAGIISTGNIEPNSLTSIAPQAGGALLPPMGSEAVGGTHKIVAGDTLAALAKQNHVKLSDLLAANPKVDPKRLQINEVITIPVPTPSGTAAEAKGTVGNNSFGKTAPTLDSGDTLAYKIKPGDTLTKIASAHGTTVKAIQAMNPGLKNMTSIRAGATLKLPARSGSTTHADPAPAASTTASLLQPGAASIR